MVKKWEDKDDKDLMFAILLSIKGGGSFQVPWDKVKKLMNSWGHGFTESAMSQRFHRRLFKEFKDAKGDDFDAALGDTAGGNHAKGGTGRKRKAPASKAASAALDDYGDNSDSDDSRVKSKKAKTAPQKKGTAAKKKDVDVAVEQPADDLNVPELSDIPELDEDLSDLDSEDDHVFNFITDSVDYSAAF